MPASASFFVVSKDRSFKPCCSVYSLSLLVTRAQKPTTAWRARGPPLTYPRSNVLNSKVAVLCDHSAEQRTAAGEKDKRRIHFPSPHCQEHSGYVKPQRDDPGLGALQLHSHCQLLWASFQLCLAGHVQKLSKTIKSSFCIYNHKEVEFEGFYIVLIAPRISLLKKTGNSELLFVLGLYFELRKLIAMHANSTWNPSFCHNQ